MSTLEELLAVDAIPKIARKDMREATTMMGDAEVRYLVDLYYQSQKMRVASSNQLIAAQKAEEPCAAVAMVKAQFQTVEQNIKLALDVYAHNHPIGARALTVKGIGPVITAGMLAHLRITLADGTILRTAGSWWRFAGLDPTCEWKKGEKRPWNASLKKLFWLLGESFVKVKGRDGAVYGQIYTKARQDYDHKNETGGFADEAQRRIDEAKKKKYKLEKGLVTLLETGKLPDKAMYEMSKRKAVKLFISHLHHVWYEHEIGEAPPKPYAFTHLDGHTDYIPPPF